jgi:hypothetical protein
MRSWSGTGPGCRRARRTCPPYCPQ